MSDSSFEIGQKVGNDYKQKVISQLEKIANQAGISVASLETGDYGSSSTSSSARGMGGSGGRGRRGSRAGTRSTGDGGTTPAPEKQYRGEPVLGETAALATPTAKDPGAAKESDVSATTRDPANAAKMSAAEAATQDPSKAQGGGGEGLKGSEYLKNERGWIGEELKGKPQLQRKLRDLLYHEQSTPADRTRVMESLANRLNYLRAHGQPNLTLEGYLGRTGKSEFYDPIRKGLTPGSNDPKADADINRALGGSNLIRGFTDQGSKGAPNFKHGDYVDSNGEAYNDFAGGRGGAAEARAYREEQQRRVAGEGPSQPAAPGQPQQRDGAPSNARVHVGEVTSAGDASSNNNYKWYDKNPYSGRTTAGAAGIEPHFPVSGDVNFKMADAEYVSRLNAAYDAMPDDKKKDFRMISGFRPAWNREADELGMAHHSSQEDIYRRAGGTRQLFPAAAPEHSRHQGGMAGDFERGPGLDWLREHGGEYGLEGASRRNRNYDYPHMQMNKDWKGANYYNPNKPADQQQQATVGPNGEMLVFGGLKGQIDRESANRIAAAKGMTPKYFDYRDTEAALRYAKGLDRPYESMGFSAGVNSQERFAEEARKRGIQLPRSATAVGQYAPEGGKQRLPNNSGVPTESYLDPSGRGLRGQVPPSNYLEGHHMPSQTDRGTMARAADAIEARIAKEKAAAAAKDVPDAAKNPASAKAKDESPKVAEKKDDK